MTSGLFDLSGKVALVTGSSVGIGRMIAQGLADAGAKVYVVSRTAADCDRAAAEIVAGGGQAVALAADLSDVDEIRRLATEVESREGKLDILVNNAGVLRDTMSFSMTEAQWDDVIRVHLKGHAACAHFAGAHWRVRSKSGEAVSGRIVNTASESGS